MVKRLLNNNNLRCHLTKVLIILVYYLNRDRPLCLFSGPQNPSKAVLNPPLSLCSKPQTCAAAEPDLSPYLSQWRRVPRGSHKRTASRRSVGCWSSIFRRLLPLTSLRFGSNSRPTLRTLSSTTT